MLTTIEENVPLWLSRSLNCRFDTTNTNLYQWQPSVQWFWGKYTSLVKRSAYNWKNLQNAQKSITLEAVCTAPKLPLWCWAVRDVMSWPLQGLSTTPPLTAVLTWPLIRSYSSWWLCGTAVWISGKILLARRDWLCVAIMGGSVHHILDHDQALFAHHWCQFEFSKRHDGTAVKDFGLILG